MTEQSKVFEYPNGIDEAAFLMSVNEGKVLVDVFTQWCGPCKRVKPIFHELSMEMDDIKFISVDLDQTRWLGEKYDIHAIPTFLFFKNGEMIYKHLGGMFKDGFVKMIKEKF
jgi:thioredoxin 1